MPNFFQPTGSSYSPTVAAELHCQRGIHFLQAENWQQAEQEFRKAVEVVPDLPKAYNNLGALYLRLGRYMEAEAALSIAVRVRGDNMAACANLGQVFVFQGNYEQAEYWIRRALEHQPSRGSPSWFQLHPHIVETYCRLGRVLENLERFSEAKELWQEAEKLCHDVLEKHPEQSDGWSLVALILSQQERFADAERFYRQAVRLQPGNVGLQSSLGKCLRKQGMLEESVRLQRDLLKIDPNMAEAHGELGLALAGMGRFEEALAHYDAAIAAQPDKVGFRFNRALAYLAQGDFQRGWQDYDLRFDIPEFKAFLGTSNEPLWDGTPLQERTLLLRAEQGIGDALQFIRLAACVPKGEGRVIVECRPVLAEILRTAPAVDGVVAQGTPRPPFDVYAPLMSLPRILGTTLASVPNRVPYLFPPADRIAYWKGELARVDGYRVGIVWECSWRGRARSALLARFAPLASIPGVRLVSLQKGPGTNQLAGSAADMSIVDFGAKTSPSLADTAALVQNLDLVVTVDTSMAHLAGSLGVRTWVALPYIDSWTWMHAREDSPWYPSLRLFRQPRPGDWTAVFGRIADSLQRCVFEGIRNFGEGNHCRNFLG